MNKKFVIKYADQKKAKNGVDYLVVTSDTKEKMSLWDMEQSSKFLVDHEVTVEVEEKNGYLNIMKFIEDHGSSGSSKQSEEKGYWQKKLDVETKSKDNFLKAKCVELAISAEEDKTLRLELAKTIYKEIQKEW